MLLRWMCGALGLFHTANGLAMIIAPRRWFLTAPGAAATGPFNAHFVIDVGLGFLAAGLAFLACAWRLQFRPVALGASGFVVFHALFHLSHFAMAAAEVPVTLAVAIPAFLGLALAWPRRNTAA